MKRDATGTIHAQRFENLGVRQRIALVLTFALIVHQLVMSLPAMHFHIMPMLATTGAATPSIQNGDQMEAVHAPAPSASAQDGCNMPYPPAEMRACAAAEAVFSRPPIIFFFALALLALVAAITIPANRAMHFVDDRHWPPDRYRAFLQVFIC